jgi:hypothetical protein
MRSHVDWAHYRTPGVFDSQTNPLNGAAPRVADQITTSPGRYAGSDNGWSVGYATNVVNSEEVSEIPTIPASASIGADLPEFVLPNSCPAAALTSHERLKVADVVTAGDSNRTARFSSGKRQCRSDDVRDGSNATDGFRASAARCPLLLQERPFEARGRNDARGQFET